MWVPFALSMGLALVGVVVNLAIAIASPRGWPKERTLDAYVVAERRPIVVEDEEDGVDRTIVATQSYVGGEWRSQLSAFDTVTAQRAWQSEQVAVPYARGMRACRFGRQIILADERVPTCVNPAGTSIASRLRYPSNARGR